VTGLREADLLPAAITLSRYKHNTQHTTQALHSPIPPTHQTRRLVVLPPTLVLTPLSPLSLLSYVGWRRTLPRCLARARTRLPRAWACCSCPAPPPPCSPSRPSLASTPSPRMHGWPSCHTCCSTPHSSSSRAHTQWDTGKGGESRGVLSIGGEGRGDVLGGCWVV
jgi:hypothetical protein